MMVAVLASWPADLEPRLTPPNNQQQKIATLTLAGGDSPTPQYPLSVAKLQQLHAGWIQTWDTQTAPKTVTLSLRIGDSPPGTRDRQVAAALSWITEPIIPGLRPTAGWNVPPVQSQVPASAFPFNIRTAWDDVWAPPQRLVSIAPLTLTYGQSAGPQAPLSATTLSQLIASWAQPWDAQSAPKNAGWNIPPILISLPYTPLPRLLWQAWEPPWVHPPRPVSIAPITLVYGQQPPPQAPLAASTLFPTVNAWIPNWDAQTAAKNAGWNVPPTLIVLPHVPPPAAIWTAWEPPWRSPQRLITIAPLTLVYGQAQPPRSPLTVPQGVVIASWPADLEPRLTWPNVPRVQIAPLTLSYGSQPKPVPPIRPGVLGAILTWHPPESWPAQSEKPSIVFTIPPGVIQTATADVVIWVRADGSIISVRADDLIIRVRPDEGDVDL